MGRRMLRALGHSVLWNACVGVACALLALAVLAGIDVVEGSGDGGGSMLAVGLIVAPLMGAVLGTAAGLVHGVAQLPLAAWAPRRERLLARLVATAVSVALVVVYIDMQTDDDDAVPLLALVPFAVYVAVTPWLAGLRYVEASADAALSAARRNGASSVSRVAGSASDSSRATSE